MKRIPRTTQAKLMTRHKLNQLRTLRGRVRLTIDIGKSRGRRREAWLFKNKRAATLVQQGLADAKQGRLVKFREHHP